MNAESRARNVLGGAGYANARHQETMDALKRQGRSHAEELYPQRTSPEQAGANLEADFRQRAIRFGREADVDYSDLRQIEAHPANARSVPTGQVRRVESGVIGPDGKQIVREVPVTEEMQLPFDMRPLKKELEAVEAEYKYTLPETDQRASLGLHAIRNILKGPDFKPASAAEKDIGLLKDAARSDIPELKDTSQGLASLALEKYERGIEEVLAGAHDPEKAIAALRQGRLKTAQKYETLDLMKEFGKPGSMEPVQVFQKLTWRGDSGIDRLRRVAAVFPDRMKEAGRAYLEGLLDLATREGDFEKAKTLFNSYHQLGPETKKILFGNPLMVKDLDNFFHLAKRLAEDPNPSGSAKLVAMEVGGTMILQSPVRGTLYSLGNSALARLLYNPRAARLLAKAMDGTAGAASAGAVRDFIQAFRKDLVPLEGAAGRVLGRPGPASSTGSTFPAGADLRRDDERLQATR
jgi:tetratricopeptide (TPR) repeat protein